jgi:hypothetical protein
MLTNISPIAEITVAQLLPFRRKTWQFVSVRSHIPHRQTFLQSLIRE